MRDLERIIRAYGPALARVAASYEADSSLREDLLQDILLAVHRAMPSLAKADSLSPFLFRIAHNRGVSHVVRQMGAKRAAALGESGAEEETPEEVVLASDRSRRLTLAVRRLPLPYRQAMTLFLEDLSYAEIAEALGISASNVGVRLNRAKALLKDMLDDE